MARVGLTLVGHGYRYGSEIWYPPDLKQAKDHSKQIKIG